MNKGKFLALASAVLPFAVFAEGETQTGSQIAQAQLSTLSTEVSSYVSAAAPVIAGVLGACLGITLLFVGWKLIKRAANRA